MAWPHLTQRAKILANNAMTRKTSTPSEAMTTMTKRRRRLPIPALSLFALSSVCSLSIPSIELKKPSPFYYSKIDFSAANEYFDAHYGTLKTPYFGQSVTMEPIYNAREGVYDEKNDCMNRATIESCGFTLLQDKPSKVSDWSSLEQIRDIYLPELRALLEETYRDCKVRHIIFWNPMVRGQDLKQTRPDDSSTTPTASFAASPHIDTDIGAYENPNDLIRLFEMNRADTDPFPRQELVKDISDGRRFGIVNAWRNIAATSVVQSPLALFSVRYDDKQKAFPKAAPNMDLSRWYIFPNMTKDELLLFCQYDRDVTRPSDLWHCALKDMHDPNAPPRNSFDIRCFIVFDEIVPRENDRFGEDRLASILTQEESGCFCDKQAEDRGIKQAN